MKTIMAWLARWFAQPDKVLHAAVGFAAMQALLMFAVAEPLPERIAAASLVVSALSWGKERFDRSRPDRHVADGWDAFATIVGAQLGVANWILWGLS